MSGDLGVVLVRFTYLLIMCVGARFHGTLYPMMGCVLYLERTVVVTIGARTSWPAYSPVMTTVLRRCHLILVMDSVISQQ